MRNDHKELDETFVFYLSFSAPFSLQYFNKFLLMYVTFYSHFWGFHANLMNEEAIVVQEMTIAIWC